MAALSAVFKNSSAVLLILFCIMNFTLDRTLIAILNKKFLHECLCFLNSMMTKIR